MRPGDAPGCLNSYLKVETTAKAEWGPIGFSSALYHASHSNAASESKGRQTAAPMVPGTNVSARLLLEFLRADSSVAACGC